MARTPALTPPDTYLVLLHIAEQPGGHTTLNAMRAARPVDTAGLIVALGGLVRAEYLERGRGEDPTYQLTERGFAWAADIAEAAS